MRSKILISTKSLNLFYNLQVSHMLVLQWMIQDTQRQMAPILRILREYTTDSSLIHHMQNRHLQKQFKLLNFLMLQLPAKLVVIKKKWNLNSFFLSSFPVVNVKKELVKYKNHFCWTQDDHNLTNNSSLI